MKKGMPSVGACPRCGATSCHQKYRPRRKVSDVNRMWLISDTNPVDGVVCPRCGEGFRVSHLEHDETCFTDLTEEFESIPNYCPNCGERLVY